MTRQGERAFTAQVHGIHFPNADGTPRQSVIARCRRGQRIEFEAEPENPHDSNAVKVLAVGQQIGYINARLSERFAKQLLDGEILGGTIARIYRLDDGMSGVEIRVRVRDGGEAGAEQQQASTLRGCLWLIVVGIVILAFVRLIGC